MKYEIDHKEIQDKEVSGWWNDKRPKNGMNLHMIKIIL